MLKTKAQIKIGKKIQFKRNALGITQEDIAEKVSLHRTYISSIERGERNMSVRNLLIICFELNIALGDIFSDIEKEDV